jgi:hypothetical protein
LARDLDHRSISRGERVYRLYGLPADEVRLVEQAAK